MKPRTSFDVSVADAKKISQIVVRAAGLLGDDTIGSRMDLSMDLTACHANGCHLDLDNLFKAPQFDFVHDVAGIARHIDRTTGKLQNCFSPRYAERAESLPKCAACTNISTFQLFATFPDEETAREYLEKRLWADGVKCPECKGKERITKRKDGYYRCNPCKMDFTVRTGTIFERSHVPLHKWVYAMYLVVTSRKGISSLQLAKEIGVTQKSAWFMLQRLREACSQNSDTYQEVIA